MQSNLAHAVLFVLSVVTYPSLAADRIYDAAELEVGQKLYIENCAVCHGQNAEGTVKEWHIRDADGNMPPPPLNGTAHTWHHPAKVLFQTISEGTERLGGKMPAWKDKLDDEEIVLIINWITSLWPDEIYEAWLRMN